MVSCTMSRSQAAPLNFDCNHEWCLALYADSTSGPQTKSDNEASANAPAEPRKAASGRRAEVQAACEELAEIMRNNDECQIYLRTCHGLEALCKQFLVRSSAAASSSLQLSAI